MAAARAACRSRRWQRYGGSSDGFGGGESGGGGASAYFSDDSSFGSDAGDSDGGADSFG